MLDLNYKININTLHRDKIADTLELNEISGFVLIDPATNRTVAAGMIREVPLWVRNLQFTIS